MSVKSKDQLEKRVDALEAKPSGGGVGEAVGKYSEIFNVYKTEQKSALSVTRNQIDDGTINNYYGCNKADGSGITLYHDRSSRGGGEGVKVSNSQYVDAYGENIDVEGRSSVVRGDNIVFKGFGPGTIVGSIIAGETIWNFENYGDTGTGTCENSAILAYVTSILGNMYRSIVTGYNHTVTNIRGTAIFGEGHTVQNAIDCIISGDRANVNDTTLRLVIGNNGSNVLTVDDTGNVNAHAYNTASADYADLFEWLDGNPDNEDRRGMLVSFARDKIIPAHGNDIDGVISNSPSVCGNDYQYWHGKYETDVYGRPLKDEAGKLIISEKYDRKKRYVPRSERPEWAPVGMCGRLVVNDDGSCLPGSYVSARYGIGTKCFSPTRIKMLKRIDEKHIEVVVRG